MHCKSSFFFRAQRVVYILQRHLQWPLWKVPSMRHSVYGRPFLARLQLDSKLFCSFSLLVDDFFMRCLNFWCFGGTIYWYQCFTSITIDLSQIGRFWTQVTMDNFTLVEDIPCYVLLRRHFVVLDVENRMQVFEGEGWRLSKNNNFLTISPITCCF